MKQLAIIVDDLSSATDCGIQMARSGLHTFVFLGKYPGMDPATSVDVVSLDTDSRSVAPEVANERVKKTVQSLHEDGFNAFYKSMDSTLRGNLGAEVDAILEVVDFDFAVIAPAFPHYGRTTLQGQHFLNNVPINQTEFARDPKNPVFESNLLDIFSKQSSHSVGLIALESLRSGAIKVVSQLNQFQSEGIKLIIFDATEEEDLDRIVEYVSKSDTKILWVGSTGLARCIPSILQVSTREPFKLNEELCSKPALFVIGSIAELTQHQLQECFTQQKVLPFPLNPFRIIAGGKTAEEEIHNCFNRLSDALLAGKDAALYLSSKRTEVPSVQKQGKVKGLGKEEVAFHLVDTLAMLTRQVLDQHDISGLIISGGDTAKAVCNRLQARGIEILAEVEPGIPLCRLEGNYPVLMVTKAGAFGTNEVLINSIEVIKRAA